MVFALPLLLVWGSGTASWRERAEESWSEGPTSWRRENEAASVVKRNAATEHQHRDGQIQTEREREQSRGGGALLLS